MNDTGIVVPGIMLGVLTPALIALIIPDLTRTPFSDRRATVS